MRVDISVIRDKAIRALKIRNIIGAEIIVDSMLAADCSGVSTHGIKMLPSYIEKYDRGEFSNGSIEIVKQTASFSKVDAKNLIGAVSAMNCVHIAMNKAKESGLHVVFSKNCNTFGPAFYYAEKMAKSKLVGFVCCNSPAAMPVNNGLEVMLGTNPLAFACPSLTRGTILVDMASSIVAKSKILQAKNHGKKIPEGWALDINGNSTTDPVEAIKGFILPMAGPKGYALALIIDLISGMLSGAGYLNKVNKFYSVAGEPMNVGQMFIAIDPSQVYDGDFLKDMDEYINIIRNSKHVEGKVITLPGDKKYEARKRTGNKTIYLEKETICKLESFLGFLEMENNSGKTLKN